MRVVMALGGNALLRRNEPPQADIQRQNVLRAVAMSVAPVARAHDLVVTHGNGPQVGLLALQTAAYRGVSPYPLDVLGAESQGMIGYLIEQTLAQELPEREIATLLTQVEVDPADPAFGAPNKPIGPIYEAEEAQALADRNGWAFVREGGGYRRVVASPAPKRIRELGTIRLLVKARVIVICAGGGGIPVVVTAEGGLRGVEAVIDKDHSAALLAEALQADALLLLTDVAAVWTEWPPTSASRPIGRTTAAELGRYAFAPGSMGPKVAAACRFAERTGCIAAIGALEEAQALLEGRAGTIVQG
ncbi:MAG TPA: carbamate kinase [Xanthobacteraceae bacterium]|nr:carbamate kinase [Xanthobacteraceae bacterium]